MALRISRALTAQMLAEADSAPGREICGLLFGRAGEEITSIQPCANVSARPDAAFEIDPASLIAAHKGQRSGGPILIGWYHSHPNGRAEPSPCDRDAAFEKGRIWVIIARGNLRAWEAIGSGALAEVELEPAD
jgi:proteasome lid subunit RPN8/RPN11